MSADWSAVAASIAAAADALMASLAAQEGSATGAAIVALAGGGGTAVDAYTRAEVDDLLAAVQGGAASREDLLVTAYRETPILASGNTVIPLIAAPFPLRLTSLALLTFQGSISVAASDTAWWLTRVRYTRASVSETAVPIATKTTRITAAAEPAGEAITRLVPWRYAQTDLAAVDLATGDVVSMVLSPQGTGVVAIPGPLVITLGYEPL